MPTKLVQETRIPQPWNSFTKPQSNFYEFYLSGPILEAEEYVDWFDQIRNAGPQDVVKLYINSPGGDLYTTIQFLRVLGETQAHTIASVEGACMSAATMIFLACDGQEITDHSVYMLHNYSSGTFGKGGEQYDQIQFERVWSEKFLSEVYRDFLTPEEVQSMLHNKDIWMDSDEVLLRLQHRKKILESKAAGMAGDQS